MTTSATSSEEAVAALFAEAQRYEAWLAALAEKRASTPAHIYDRVHADYTARLQRVTEELGGQRAALQELEGTLLQRLTALDIGEAQHRDEVAEAELRAAVGELTSEQHEEVTARTTAALAAIVTERETIAPQLSHVRAVLAVGAEVRPAPEDDAAAPSAAPAPSGDAGGFDELNFLRSLVESRLDGASPTAPGAVHVAAESAGERGAAAAASRQEASGSVATEQQPRAGAAPAAAGTDAGRSGVAEEMPPYLKDVQPEQVKTLKCQECGTLNYPTEWYCERCGAELAAL